MSAIYEVAKPETVKGLLDRINESEIALPHFQRSFVWSLDKSRSLLVNMMQGYPAGAMLAIRLDSSNRGMMFKIRNIENAPSLVKNKQVSLVLDGQQRLTSLYHALYGHGEYRHYLDFEKLRKDPKDIESALISLRLASKKEKAVAERYSVFEEQAKCLMMPLSILQDGAAAFGKWSIEVSHSHQAKESRELDALFKQIEKSIVSPLLDYEFPWIVLKSDTPDIAIASVFDAINNTGQRLSIFDLVVARTWKSGESTIQDKWNEALESVDGKESLLGDYEVDPVYALNVCALLTTKIVDGKLSKDPACGRGEILRLKKHDISTHWDDAIYGLNRALFVLVQNGGLLAKKWLPYEPLLIPMAAVFAMQRGAKRGKDVGRTVESVMRWYWCTCLTSEYDQGAMAKAARDYKQLIEWINGGDTPAVVSGIIVKDVVNKLHSTTPKNGALYKALMCLLSCRHPMDMLHRQPITPLSLSQYKIDDHHVFPKAFLGSSKQRGATYVNSILNRTLIDAQSNRELGKTAPSKYFGKIKGSTTAAKYKMLIESHLISQECQVHLSRDNFEGFLNARANVFESRIQEVTSG